MFNPYTERVCISTPSIMMHECGKDTHFLSLLLKEALSSPNGMHIATYDKQKGVASHQPTFTLDFPCGSGD